MFVKNTRDMGSQTQYTLIQEKLAFVLKYQNDTGFSTNFSY